jgi:hypothetical protein
MRAFISHARSNQDVALNIRDLLEGIGVETFVAHLDLRPSQEWRNVIVDQLRSCELFVPLLSSAFKRSDWCGHETGMAIGRSEALVILPISIDGAEPFGLLSNLQSYSLEGGEVSEEIFLSAIGSKWPAVVVDLYIQRLDGAHSFRAAESLMKPLVPYFSGLTRAQATLIARKSVENGQIWSAALCRTDYLPAFMRLNRRRIPADVLRALRFQVAEQRWYNLE